MLRNIFIIVLFIVSPGWTWASQGEDFKTRGLRIGLSYNHLLNSLLENTSSSGIGIKKVFEFHIKPRFTLGIDLQYRHFSGEETLGELGYGLLMKHYLNDNESFRPFVEYGLLMNVARVEGREGSGTAHDTRLAVGADIVLNELPLFVDLSFHYSRLRYFDVPEIVLDYIQLGFGYRFNW